MLAVAYRESVRENDFYNDVNQFNDFLKVERRELKHIRCRWYELLNADQLKRYHELEIIKLKGTKYRSNKYVRVGAEERVSIDNILREQNVPEYVIRNFQLANYDGLTDHEPPLCCYAFNSPPHWTAV